MEVTLRNAIKTMREADAKDIRQGLRKGLSLLFTENGTNYKFGIDSLYTLQCNSGVADCKNHVIIWLKENLQQLDSLDNKINYSKNKFYVYAHLNPLTNEIFYIGKAQGKRAYYKHGRTKLWYETVKKYGYIVDILEEGLTEDEAFEREMWYIEKIGRLDLGKGPLVNLTDGGRTNSGAIVSDETKEKLSKVNTGKKHSEETKKKMSESHQNRYDFDEEDKALNKRIEMFKNKEK